MVRPNIPISLDSHTRSNSLKILQSSFRADMRRDDPRGEHALCIALLGTAHDTNDFLAGGLAKFELRRKCKCS